MKNITELYGEMRDELSRSAGLTLREGGDMSIRLMLLASQLHALWINQEFVKRQMFPQTAAGEFLDMHAGLRGLERQGASFARGLVRFYVESAADGAIVIPEGVCCVTAAGAEFLTVSAGEIAAGETICDVAAIAKTPGKSGNIPAGSIAYMTLAPVSVAGCGNIIEFSGGADSESDESIRQRILKSYRLLPNGANKAYYETQVLNIEGVAAVSVIPRARGIGTVDVYIAGENGAPDSDTLLRVRDILNSQREICVDLKIMAPVIRTVNIELAVKPKAGYGFGEVKAGVLERIGAYFNGELLGENILRARLGEISFGAPGVENYYIISPALDIAVQATELPVLGTLNILNMG